MRTAAFLAAASSVLIAQESPQTPAPRTAAQPPATQQEAAATKPDPYYGLELVHRLAWRGIGPANMGGRITDLDVPAEQPNTWYVATAGGDAIRPHRETADRVDYRVPANGRLVLGWD